MSHARDGQARARNRGQALVELALSLPLLLTVMMGVIDLSFVLYAHIQVAAATGQGARAGALFVGDLTQILAQNDSSREQAIRNAIYDTGTGTTTLGLLKTTSPNFNVSSDVQVSYPNGAPADPTNTSRTGEDVLVTVVYRQPLWFGFLPGAVSGALQVSSTARVRIQ